MGHNVEVLFKREYWSGTIIDKDVIWNNEKRDYVVLVTDPRIGGFVETPYYKDGQFLGYLIYASAISIRPPKKKESVLECFKNLLVIDPQEDCECETEVYDADGLQHLVWLRDGLPEVVKSDSTRISLPMSKQINFEQIKQCVLTSLPFAKPMSKQDDPYYMVLINSGINIDKLSIELKERLARFKAEWSIIRLPEIPKDKIYFSPESEFLGCFTWNISRYGMFIMPDRLRFCVI